MKCYNSATNINLICKFFYWNERFFIQKTKTVCTIQLKTNKQTLIHTCSKIKFLGKHY